MAHTENHACPDDETLLSYLLAPKGAAGSSVALHLDRCDTCVGELTRVQRRLALSQEIAMTVPAALVRQATAATGAVEKPSRWARWAEQASEWLEFLRPQILVPVGMAALALVVIVTRSTPPGMPPQTVELTRDVQLNQSARVTAPAGRVRAQPDLRAVPLRTLARGDAVVLFDRQEDWYHVTLPDGTKGWIEVSAFE